MSEENEYEIEEGDITRFFFVRRMKDRKEFIVEQVHYSVSDTIQDNLYDKNGEPIMGSVGGHRKECREIRAVITKYLEKKGKGEEKKYVGFLAENGEGENE